MERIHIPRFALSLLIAILIAVGSYQFGRNSDKITQKVFRITPTPTPKPVSLLATMKTSQWQSYRDEEYMYQVKYPPTWSLETDVTQVRFVPKSAGDEFTDPPFQVLITTEQGEEKALRADLKTSIEEYKVNDQLQVEPVTVSGEKTTLIKGVLNGYPRYTTSFVIGDMMYTITVVFFEDSFESIETKYTDTITQYRQVLETFLVSVPTPENFTCPKKDYINCMPIVSEDRKADCDPEYLKWVAQHCINFKGVTY